MMRKKKKSMVKTHSHFLLDCKNEKHFEPGPRQSLDDALDFSLVQVVAGSIRHPDTPN